MTCQHVCCNALRVCVCVCVQVHSAMISAALGGHLDVLLELKQYSDPTLYVQPPAGTAGGDDDYEESDDKTEL